MWAWHISMSSLWSSLPSSLSRLELLSTITEIRGYLRIQGWQHQTFPYLRNLRRIGSPNGTTDNSFCNDGQRCEFSFLQFSSTTKLIFAYWKFFPCRWFQCRAISQWQPAADRSLLPGDHQWWGGALLQEPSALLCWQLQHVPGQPDNTAPVHHLTIS